MMIEQKMERERERERAQLMILVTTTNRVAKESKVVVIAKGKRAMLSIPLMRTHDHNISLGIFFRNNEIMNYFYVMS